eukprot:1775895-Karenia_brevis.AAC.1
MHHGTTAVHADQNIDTSTPMKSVSMDETVEPTKANNEHVHRPHGKCANLPWCNRNCKRARSSD